MSYKSRQRKREYRKAERAEARSQHQRRVVNADAWYLTIVKSEAHCAGCGGTLREGSDMVFRYSPLEMLCVPCGQSREIKFRPSRSWDQRERKRRGRKSRPMIADRSASASTTTRADQKAFGEDMLRRVREIRS